MPAYGSASSLRGRGKPRGCSPACCGRCLSLATVQDREDSQPSRSLGLGGRQRPPCPQETSGLEPRAVHSQSPFSTRNGSIPIFRRRKVQRPCAGNPRGSGTLSAMQITLSPQPLPDTCFPSQLAYPGIDSSLVPRISAQSRGPSSSLVA